MKDRFSDVSKVIFDDKDFVEIENAIAELDLGGSKGKIDRQDGGPNSVSLESTKAHATKSSQEKVIALH